MTGSRLSPVSASGRRIITYDYVIIGAGSAGCAIAERLSADPAVSVLLIEAGPSDNHPLIQMPKGFPFMAMNPRYAWNFMTEPQPHRNFGSEMWPRGKMLGGSSSLNGMLYLRGHPGDYARWAEAAESDVWSWGQVARCFRELECHSLGESELRGGSGPLAVTAGTVQSDLSEKMVAAGEQLGLRRLEDFNGPEQEGIGFYAVNIKDGLRFSAAKAHLRRARGRRNLTIRSETLAERIVFEGTRAVGVVIRRGERPEVVRAGREVVVCTGTLLTPRLLMLSGVGDAGHLRDHGIAVVADNAHVGRHLRDHVGLRLGYRLQGAQGANASLRWPGLAGTIARYLLFRSGPLATTGEVGAFVRAHPGATRPDGQLMLSAMSQSAPRPGTYMGPVEKLPGLSAHACVLDADSEGYIALASGDPADSPRIQPNGLSTAHDRDTLLNLVRIVRRLVAQPALAPYIAHEAFPGPAINSDDEILDYANRTARNFNHAVGTCRLGSAATGAVDARLRVHGVAGLRVADCSIMPSLPAGNTNGPAQMVGWRAAELIREDARG
jgi:choline dehydrogenase-like flavoprotein